MVTDWIIGVLHSVLSAVLDWLPAWSLPSWFATGSGSIATVLGYAGSLGAWVPLGLATTVLGGLLVVWAAAFVVKVVRIVASFATFGGGSAA